MGEGEVKVTCLDGPALCFSNHQANGETVLRTGKVVKQPGDEHGMWNYSKLCYNTKYPWEAAPEESGEKAVSGAAGTGEPGEKEAPMTAGSGEPAGNRKQCRQNYRLRVEAQQYVLQDGYELSQGLLEETGRTGKANVTFWRGQKDGVLYRRQFFDYTLERECHWIQAMNLADFAVPFGIMRVDKLRLHRAPVLLTLGSYGFPDNGTEIIEKSGDNGRAIVLKGRDALGNEKQMAMTIYDGWQELSLLHSEGTNPDSRKSVILYASMERKKQYGGFEPYVLISQVITKESHEDFREDELFPVAEILYTDPERCGSYGPVTLKMKDGSVKRIDFDHMEGGLSL